MKRGTARTTPAIVSSALEDLPRTSRQDKAKMVFKVLAGVLLILAQRTFIEGIVTTGIKG